MNSGFGRCISRENPKICLPWNETTHTFIIPESHKVEDRENYNCSILINCLLSYYSNNSLCVETDVLRRLTHKTTQTIAFYRNVICLFWIRIDLIAKDILYVSFAQ